MNVETLSVLLEDRVADLTSDGDSDGAELWLQALTKQGQALLKNGTLRVLGWLVVRTLMPCLQEIETYQKKQCGWM